MPAPLNRQTSLLPKLSTNHLYRKKIEWWVFQIYPKGQFRLASSLLHLRLRFSRCRPVVLYSSRGWIGLIPHIRSSKLTTKLDYNVLIGILCSLLFCAFSWCRCWPSSQFRLAGLPAAATPSSWPASAPATGKPEDRCANRSAWPVILVSTGQKCLLI